MTNEILNPPAPDGQDNPQDEPAPGPLEMFRKIPRRVRWWLYSIGLTVFAIEGVLDIAGSGLIPERQQGIFLGVLGLFGFTTAVANTPQRPAS